MKAAKKEKLKQMLTSHFKPEELLEICPLLIQEQEEYAEKKVEQAQQQAAKERFNPKSFYIGAAVALVLALASLNVIKIIL